MFAQQGTQLILETHPLMMLFLFGDVFLLNKRCRVNLKSLVEDLVLIIRMLLLDLPFFDNCSRLQDCCLGVRASPMQLHLP